jgi:hypothetical protein
LRKITLDELRELAVASKDYLWNNANSVGRDVILYLHWSAGRYGQFYEDYHINIDADGSLFISNDNLAVTLSHTWHRNTGAIGISLAACYGATTDNLGDYAPTKDQVEAMAQVIAMLCESLDLTIDRAHVMTHAEAAEDDEYGYSTTCERWDLLMLATGDEPWSGGETLRGKGEWYRCQK